MQTRIDKALKLVEYGAFDGGHHKMWVIDQILRALLGVEEEGGTNKAYEDWVKDFENGEDGPHTYEWDVGTPP